MNLLHPESTPFWVAVIFIILLFLLKKFAWKPILEAINQREESISQALASAQEAKKEVANLKADNQKLLEEARKERDAILKEARQIKEKMVSEAKEQAHNEAQSIISQAKSSIENEKKAAIAELKNQVASLSLDIAQRVVQTQLSSQSKQEELVQSMLKDVKLN